MIGLNQRIHKIIEAPAGEPLAYENPAVTVGYIKRKIKLLKDFCVQVTPELETKMFSYKGKTRISLDNFCRDLIYGH